MNGLGVWEWGGIILKWSLCVMRETEIKNKKKNKKIKTYWSCIRIVSKVIQ